MHNPRLELRTLAGYRHEPHLCHTPIPQDRCSSRTNRTANGAQRDAAGVLYSQNAIPFQATPIYKRPKPISRNLPTVILCTSRVPNVIYIYLTGSADNRGSCNTRPQLQYDCQGTDFHETHNASTALFGNIPYRFSPKSNKEYEKYGTKSFAPMTKYCRHWADFHETRASSTSYKKNTYMQFHENP
jgi:hypothetical protein